LANDTQTLMGRVRAAKGSPCRLCGTKYLSLYRFNGLEICYNCFKKHFPREWRLLRWYRFYAAGIVPFTVWLAAGCPTNIREVRALRSEGPSPAGSDLAGCGSAG